MITDVPYLAVEGETVTLIITPDEGYELESLVVTCRDAACHVSTTCTGDTCTFIMPAFHIRIVVVFRPVTTGNAETWHAASLRAWTVNGVLYVSGLTPGTSWNVYNIVGTLVYQGVASSDKAEITLPGRGIYIVADGQTVGRVNY